MIAADPDVRAADRLVGAWHLANVRVVPAPMEHAFDELGRHVSSAVVSDPGKLSYNAVTLYRVPAAR